MKGAQRHAQRAAGGKAYAGSELVVGERLVRAR